MKKRYAAHYLFDPRSGYQKLHGVEVENGYVVDTFPVDEERPGTQWLPGVIRLEQAHKEWEAWHLYPFDFISMQPADGTRRRRLL